MKSKTIIAVAVLALCWQHYIFGTNMPEGKSKIQARLDSISALEPLRSSQFGILAVKMSGDTVAEYASMKKMVPASNMKLITTGLALNELGSDYRFETKIGYSGSISGGVLNGDLYIIGGGDPTIGSKDTIAMSVETLFAKWKNFLSKAGIKAINGSIIGDGRYFEGPIEEESWQYEDIGTYYGTGGNGLCFYRNIQGFKVIPAKNPGSNPEVTPTYPDTPWMKFSYNCTTGDKGTGDKLYLFGTDLYPVAEMRGSYGVDRKQNTVKCSNKFGAYTCAYYFMKYLIINGINIKGGCADIDVAGRIRKSPGSEADGSPAEASGKINILGKTNSPEIKRIAYITNNRSDNFYADALFRLMGKKFAGSAKYETCQDYAGKALSKLGIDAASGCRIIDGSGLSKKNYLSPDFFCRFLKAMTGTPVFETYIGTLTQPDQGSQAGRLKNSPEQMKERIYWKSGSMDGVRCYSGYILPSNGIEEDTIIFSVMLNNCTAPSWKMNLLLDSIIAGIAAEN